LLIALGIQAFLFRLMVNQAFRSEVEVFLRFACAQPQGATIKMGIVLGYLGRQPKGLP
jgi:hypothetical protein